MLTAAFIISIVSILIAIANFWNSSRPYIQLDETKDFRTGTIRYEILNKGSGLAYITNMRLLIGTHSTEGCEELGTFIDKAKTVLGLNNDDKLTVISYEKGDLLQSAERDNLIEIFIEDKSKIDNVINALKNEMKFKMEYRNRIFIKYLLKHNWIIT